MMVKLERSIRWGEVAMFVGMIATAATAVSVSQQKARENEAAINRTSVILERLVEKTVQWETWRAGHESAQREREQTTKERLDGIERRLSQHQR